MLTNLNILPIQESHLQFRPSVIQGSRHWSRKTRTFSNSTRTTEVCVRNGITYLPIYYCMFYQSDKTAGGTDLVIPEIKLV